LVRYHAGGDESSALVDFEMQEIANYVRNDSTINSKVKLRDLFRTRSNRQRMLIAVLLGFYSQWSGIGVVSVIELAIYL
jgi:hypothetical protein